MQASLSYCKGSGENLLPALEEGRIALGRFLRVLLREVPNLETPAMDSHRVQNKRL